MNIHYNIKIPSILGYKSVSGQLGCDIVARQLVRWSVGHVDRWTSGYVDRWKSGHVGMWACGQVDKWTGGLIRGLHQGLDIDTMVCDVILNTVAYLIHNSANLCKSPN